MQKSTPKKIISVSFWVSVLLHLLLLLSFSTAFLFNQAPVEQQKSPKLFVPSYVYKGAIAPSTPSKAVARMAAKSAPEPVAESGLTSAIQQERGMIVHSKQAKKTMRAEKQVSAKQSVMMATRAVLQQNQREALHTSKDSEPIYLIGDDSSVADPLIKLMGRALSAHFEYPRLAGELGIKGRVIIGLTLHPEGHFSHVEMIRSSDNEDLDAAALYAVNSAPMVMGADRFLEKPKHFVIGFIFR